MYKTGKFYTKLAVPDGTTFPTHTSIEVGSLFHKNDEGLLYIYSGEWRPIPVYTGVPNVGDAIRWNGEYWIPSGISASGGVVGAFLDLTDVPNTYTGSGGYTVTVKDNETGLEFSAGRGEITYLVAASDASDKSKNLADYTCDGTADEVQINAAIAALPAGGGRVVLSEGSFTCAAVISTLPAKPVILQGQGSMGKDENFAATVLSFTLAAQGDCIQFGDNHYGQTVERLAIDGDDTNTRYGIYLTTNCAFKTVRDVTITNIVTTGVRCDDGASQSLFERVQCRNLDNGFKTYGVTNRYIACQATRTSVGGNEGFYMGDADGFFIGCFAERHDIGFRVQAYSKNNALIGSTTENCNVSLDINGAAPNQPQGTTVIAFGSHTAQDVADGAIMVQRCDGTTLSGTRINSPVSNIGIQITVNCADLIVTGGYITGATSPVSDAGGARVKIQGVWGYITENSGTGTIPSGSTYDSIGHGLADDPVVAGITITLTENPTNTPGAIWVDSIGEGAFTVRCENQPGESGLDFSWRAMLL